MAFQEIEAEESSGFRNDTFEGVIKDICFQEKMRTENFYNYVSFVFEDGSDLDLFEPKDWKKFNSCSRIINSLGKNGIRWYVDEEERLIKTKPDITGKECVPLKVKMIVDVQHKTSNGEEKTYYNWDIEILDPTQIGKAGGRGKSESKNDEPDDAIIQECENVIYEILEENESAIEKDLIKGITAKYPDLAERKPIQSVRKQVIQKMIEEGTIEDNVGTYTLV